MKHFNLLGGFRTAYSAAQREELELEIAGLQDQARGRDAAATSHSSICGADCDDFHLADGVIHPPDNGMEAENGDLPVSAVCSTGREISLFCDVSSEGFEP